MHPQICHNIFFIVNEKGKHTNQGIKAPTACPWVKWNFGVRQVIMITAYAQWQLIDNCQLKKIYIIKSKKTCVNLQDLNP